MAVLSLCAGLVVGIITGTIYSTIKLAAAVEPVDTGGDAGFFIMLGSVFYGIVAGVAAFAVYFLGYLVVHTIRRRNDRPPRR